MGRLCHHVNGGAGTGDRSASRYDPETDSIPDRDPIIQESIFQRNWTGNERQNKADSGNQEVYRISYDQWTVGTAVIFNCVIWFNSFLQELVNIFSRLLQQITVVEIVVLFISVMFLKFSQTSEYSERIQKMK